MGEPEDLPKGYGKQFEYDFPSDEEVMKEAEKIPDVALETIFKDAYVKFAAGDHPDQDKYKGEFDARFVQWCGDRGDEILSDLKDWIPAAFERFLKPDPSGFDGLIGELKALRSKFGIDDDEIKDTEFADINNAKDNLLDWEGAFADSARNYLNNLDTIYSNHGKVAKALWYNMEANKAVYAQARANAKWVATGTIAALEWIHDHWPWDGKNGDTKLAYAIALGTLGSVAGGPLGFTAAMLAAGATIAAATNEDSPGIDATLAGDDAWAVLSNMSHALTTLDGQIEEQERQVAKGFRDGVSDRITDIINKDFKAKTPDDSDLLPLAIDANPEKLYQEDKGGE